MVLSTLPSNEEIIFAVSEPPQGEGQEARVFKVHTNPHFTVRQSIELPNDKVFQYLSDSQLIMQPDILAVVISLRLWLILGIRLRQKMPLL